MVNISKCVSCKGFPCLDIKKECHSIPGVDVSPGSINMIMVSEAPANNPDDNLYASGDPFYLRTTLQAFQDAGHGYSSMKDIIDSGIYITTAIKCGKAGYSISTSTIHNCSKLLEKELELFPNIKAIVLMGDVAIKSLNYIAKKSSGKRIIPNGSTYKIRHDRFYYGDIRVFPSYLQTGQNYLIERSKRQMISDDLKNALELIR